MDKPTVISKKVYMSMLAQQKETFEQKVQTAQDDLETLEDAILDLEDTDFNEVEVTEENGAYTFSIIKE